MGPVHRIRQGLPIWLLLSATAMLLVGCGGFMDVTVEFAANEKWEADVVYTLPADLVALTGLQEVEAALEDEAESFEAKGARMTWKSSESDGDLIYNVKVTGTGLDRLAETVFYGNARIYLEERDGRRVIHFSHSESLAMGAVWELTLKGGEILSGNGRQIDKQTMTWQNHYGPIEATLTESGSFSAGPVLGIAAGALAVGAVAYGAMQLWQRKPDPYSNVCPVCGFSVPPGARFCPGCGTERR